MGSKVSSNKSEYEQPVLPEATAPEQTRTFLEDLEDFVLKAEEWKQVASTQKYKIGQSYNEQIFLCL